jgi:hypothetical protein
MKKEIKPCIHKWFHNQNKSMIVECGNCKSHLFTKEETFKLETKINKLFTKDSKKARLFIKESDWIKK